MKRASFLLLAILLAGCGASPESYYPLELGKGASYNVRAGFVNMVYGVRASRVVSVAGERGFEMLGTLGTSRLAWKKGALVSDRLANAWFNPPMTLLAPNKLKEEIAWQGKLQYPGATEDATATLTQKRESIQIGGRKFNAIHASIVLDTPKRQIEVESYYAPGVGLVKQNQRTNGRFDLEIELLADN